MMTQTLTQLITGLTSADALFLTIPNQPSNATAVSQSAHTLVTGIIAILQTTQKTTLSFASQATPMLNTDLASVNAGNTFTAQAQTSTVITNANQLKITYGGLIPHVQYAKSQFAGFANQLTGIQQTLQSQINTLQSQLQTDQGEVALYSKKKALCLSMGPFGTFGAIIANNAMNSWNAKANACSAQLDPLNANLIAVNALIANATSINNTFITLISQLITINNSVDMVSGDVDMVSNFLTHALNAQAASYLTMAIHEVTLLQGAAS